MRYSGFVKLHGALPEIASKEVLALLDIFNVAEQLFVCSAAVKVLSTVRNC